MNILFDTDFLAACLNVHSGGHHPNNFEANELRELVYLNNWVMLAPQNSGTVLQHKQDPTWQEAAQAFLTQWRQLPTFHDNVDQEQEPETGLFPTRRAAKTLLEAILDGSSDFLITQNTQLQWESYQHGLENQVMGIQDGLNMLRQFTDQPTEHPAAHRTKTYMLNLQHPLFSPYYADYPNFDAWLEQAQREHYDCFSVGSDPQNPEGLLIAQPELDSPYGLAERLLRIGMFGLVDPTEGSRVGELLLRTLFDHAYRKRTQQIYSEIYPHHTQLVNLFTLFGFGTLKDRNERGEIVLVKTLQPDPKQNQTIHPLQYNLWYGPNNLLVTETHILPVETEWYEKLFPHPHRRQQTFRTDSGGNSLIKTWVMPASQHNLQPGSTLMFYHTSPVDEIQAVGVAEDIKQSTNTDDILRFLGKRTVYSRDHIKTLCARGEVLAVRFRHDRDLNIPWSYKMLRSQGALPEPPNQVVSITDTEHATWFQKQLNLRRSR